MHHQLAQINIKDLAALVPFYDFVFIDTSVAQRFFPQLEHPNILKVTDCEAQKNIEGYTALSEWLLQNGVVRSSKVLIIGGGALTDLAGFVSATVLRGISFDVVPTTLLAMIDASIGGKVAINTAAGKNLIGTFAFAQKVFLCHQFLDGLEQEQLQSGMGELSKYALLSSEINQAIFNRSLDEIISLCAQYKMDIVSQDAQEKGLRKILNLGHTFGHAFELLEVIPHGVAVAKGILGILNLYNPSLLSDYQNILAKLNLPITKPVGEFNQFAAYLNKDKKKASSDAIDIIIPRSIGNVEITRVQLSQLLSDLRSHEYFADLK